MRSNVGALAYTWLISEDQRYEQSSEYNSLKTGTNAKQITNRYGGLAITVRYN